MADFLIQDSTLEAIGDAIREGLGSQFLTGYTDGEGNLLGTISAYYEERVDTVDEIQITASSSEQFIRYDYLAREDNGLTVPVIYDAAGDENVYYYEGLNEIDGEIFNKWRQIEPEGEWQWSSVGKKYRYTDVIVGAYDDKISPLDMPMQIKKVAQKNKPIISSCTVEIDSFGGNEPTIVYFENDYINPKVHNFRNNSESSLTFMCPINSSVVVTNSALLIKERRGIEFIYAGEYDIESPDRGGQCVVFKVIEDNAYIRFALDD